MEIKLFIQKINHNILKWSHNILILVLNDYWLFNFIFINFNYFTNIILLFILRFVGVILLNKIIKYSLNFIWYVVSVLAFLVILYVLKEGMIYRDIILRVIDNQTYLSYEFLDLTIDNFCIVKHWELDQDVFHLLDMEPEPVQDVVLPPIQDVSRPRDPLGPVRGG